MQANRPLLRSAARGILLATACSGLLATAGRAQSAVPDTSGPRLMHGIIADYRRTLDLHRIDMLPPPGWSFSAQGSAASWAGALFDSTVAFRRSDADDVTLRQHLLRKVMGQRFVADSATGVERGLFGLSRNTVDMHIEGELQFQVSSARQRNLACTPADVQIQTSNCRGGFTAPKIDNTITLAAGGTFLQRFLINIAYNSTADYAASNIIRVSYQGLEDEKLQQVNVGSVQLTSPSSRFLVATVPTNNFGISARAVFGPVTVQGILAAQKGSSTNNKHFNIGSSVVEPQDKLARDIDYAQGRAFWVVDPTKLAGYPAVDVLNASRIAVTPDVQPVDVRIYRYEAGNASAGASANFNGITAQASNGAERVGALRWRLLSPSGPNPDYWLDPSGLWFVLANNNIPTNYLAVSYRTRDGHLVGSLPTIDNPAAGDSLRLIYLPNRTAASSLFAYEMRQVYEIAGASLVRSTLTASILVANSERPTGSAGTFLSILGLAIPQNPALLDIDNRVFPRVRDPGATVAIKTALLIFPNAQPFGSAVLDASQRNDSLYRTPEYLLASQGPPSVFKIHLQYSASGGSDRNSISLDALQIAIGSERITVNDVLLKNTVDYSIDYETGRVNFFHADSLFSNGQASVDVQFESRGYFAQAPTSIAGLSASWQLGDRKVVNLIGLYQSEQTPYTRPKIGNEPRASLLAGVTTDLTWNTPSLTRFLNHIVKTRTNAPSLVQLTGELAMSRPDANRSGDAYLEEFEDDRSVLLSAFENRWVPGSVPQSNRGVESILPFGFDSAQAVQFIWQNAIPASKTDSIAVIYPQGIDPTITVTASTTPTPEPVLWFTVHADTAGGQVDSLRRSHWSLPARPNQPRWRSVTTALSNTGLDLTRNDYFQFALYESDQNPIEKTDTRIILDLGKVSEDALTLAPTTYRIADAADAARTGLSVGDTLYTGRQYVGHGRLDTEKTKFNSWQQTVDDNGILSDRPDSLIGPGGLILTRPALCQAHISGTVIFFPWGDLGARCTNRNSFPDTEDLDGDNVLDAQGPNDDVFRYVIDLKTDSAKYFVRSYTPSFPGVNKQPEPYRDASGHTAHWNIYRVPLHTADDTIGSPDMHLIKQLRMTVVVPPEQGSDSVIHFALAMMRFTGAAWLGRNERPISSISGAIPETHGEVLVGTVSSQDSIQLGYTSPPGVVTEAGTVSVTQSAAPVQINEKSLRIQANDLRPGERAEAYSQLGSALNLLNYRTVRAWFRGGLNLPGWADGRLQAYLKVGSDVNNFYVYRTTASAVSWDPEFVIDLQVWRDLREKIEVERLHQVPPSASDWRICGGDSTAYVACNGPYMVQMRDPLVNPPNLAAVQELAAGMYYARADGLPIAHTELWVDDIRVSDPISAAGYAGALAAHIQGADLFTLDVGGVYQDGNFHAMNLLPSYQNTTAVTSAATIRFDRFLSPRFGLVIPASYSASWGWLDPQLLASTDVQATGLDDLRRPRNRSSNWAISVRHPQRIADNFWLRYVIDGLSLNGSGSSGLNISSLSDATADNWNASVNYFLSIQTHSRSLHLQRFVAHLPKWLQKSTIGRGLAGASYSLVPTSLQASSALAHSMGELQSYSTPITSLADTILKPLTSEQFTWRNSAGFSWRPIALLNVTSAWSSTRDLRTYSDSTTLGRVVNAAHRELFGTDVGVERDRNINNSITIAPHLTSWLNPSVTLQTNFFLSRSLASRNPVRFDGDTAGAYILPQTIDNSRSANEQLIFDPHILLQRLFGDSSGLARATTRVRSISVSRVNSEESTFDLATFNPSLGYQLALGSFDSFLNRNGTQAIGAATSQSILGRLSMILPGNFSADLNYQETASDRYQQRPSGGFVESTGSTVSWPSGTIRWSRLFPNGFLTSISAASQIQRDRASSESPFGDGSLARSVSDASRVTPSLTVLFRNGISINASSEVDHSAATTNGNNTLTDALTLSTDVSYTARMPHFISKSRRSMTAQLRFLENRSSSCLQQASDSTCVPYYDLTRSEVSGTLSALLERGISTGFNGSYVLNSVLSSGQKSSTITLSLFVRLPLTALEF